MVTSAEQTTASTEALDRKGLEHALRAAIEGEVRFGVGDRALYATDASNYRQVPIGVVIPRTSDDVLQAVAICRQFGAPLINRGGGTSLAGQGCNTAVMLDMSKYLNHVLEVDPERRLARVQPGTILDDLRHETERHHLTFGPDPATHNHCTLGGMIGNDSCGVHSVITGRTADNVESLDILTYDGTRLRVGRTTDEAYQRLLAAGGREGEIYGRLNTLRERYGDAIRTRFPAIPRRVSGFTLEKLLPEHDFHVARALVGSESTCVTILEATVNLVPSPPARVLVVLGYDDIYQACDNVPAIMSFSPIGLEGFDDHLVDDMRRKGLHTENLHLLPDGGGWLLAEFGADDPGEAQARANELISHLSRIGNPAHRLLTDSGEAEKVWKVRESGLGAAAVIPGRPQTWPGWEDSAVPPDRFGDYLRDFRALLRDYRFEASFYGHFGQGCLHTRVGFDLVSREGIRTFRQFITDAADLVVRYGGSFSGEHGDGQARAELLEKMYGAQLVEAFREFKTIWDPQGKMNPGKVVDPYRLDENLRLGEGYRPRHVQTRFQFPDDEGSFAKATMRCVGVGRCRRLSGGTMCPSFMATREEEHSTRGRAHLLFEMMRGDVLTDSWKSEEVKQALDLCLACKGCKGECPVNVDMATYKAEFLSHYYEGRLRPLTAYSMGLIYWWARLAALAPRTINLVTHAPVLGQLAKRVAGIAAERRIPQFAPRTFVSWFRSHPRRYTGGERILLWPDTFNNHFHPETARAAVRVLEAAGYAVSIPGLSLCCGRPLYDFGMLDAAQRLLKQVMDALETELEAGTPIIGLEPSCVSVFRDELVNLFPRDPRARKLKEQTFLLSEFVEQHHDRFDLPRLERKALVQMHCHQKSILGTNAETSILTRLGLDADVLDSGCCGMAGAFGFERAGEHYDVSMRCGERVLLPAVRESAPDTLLIANGFSCREQVSQATGREPQHIAQVLEQALMRDGRIAPDEDQDKREARTMLRMAPAIALGAAAAGATIGLWRRNRRHRVS